MKKILLALGVLVLVGAGCKGGASELNIQIDSPTNVELGESFDVTVTIENPGEDAHVLDSIDIGTSYLDGIVIASSIPIFTDTFHIPVDNTTSHTFETDIPAGESLDVTFSMIAFASGLFSGDFDVCIDTGYTCEFLSISTNVIGDDEFDLSLDLDAYSLVVDAPSSASTGEVVEVKATITNNKDTDAILDSIDIAEEYIAGIDISSASPPFTDFFTLETDNTRSHSFQTTIPAGESVEVTFYGTALESGEYSGAFDVCMDVGYNCWFETISTEVVE